MISEHSPNYTIIYPYISNITYKNCNSFIQIHTNNNTYYGFESKQLLLIDKTKKQRIKIFETYQKPNENHYKILKNATHKLKGKTFQLLYVNNHQYLCLSIVNNTYVSLVILNISLNSKGYYEIENIIDILKEK